MSACKCEKHGVPCWACRQEHANKDPELIKALEEVEKHRQVLVDIADSVTKLNVIRRAAKKLLDNSELIESPDGLERSAELAYWDELEAALDA